MSEFDHKVAEAILLHSREVRDLTGEFRNAMARLGSLCELATKEKSDAVNVAPPVPPVAPS